MRLVSWNVNGVRAIVKKEFLSSVSEIAPDILCLQETKAQDEQVAQALAELEDYHIASNSAEKLGYSGTAILSRQEPLSISKGIGIVEHDNEGRVITAEFDRFFLVNVYTPNSGNGLRRLEYRQLWDREFLKHLQTLEKTKPVITCGDFNVANKDIDLARPKPNYNKTAGYTQAEIDGMDNILAANFTDTFRYLHPETVKYSWWSYRAGARGKNIGWRIDYIICSQNLNDQIQHADILNDYHGSDHCPVLLDIK